MNYHNLSPLYLSTYHSVRNNRLQEKNLSLFVLAILIGATCYQLFLCFVSTNIFPISRTLVGVAEAILLLICIPLLLKRILPGVVILILLSAAAFCLLRLFSPLTELKGFRDILIPLWFFWLGCNFGRPDMADKYLKILAGVVIVFAFIELFFLDHYVQIFNIAEYYINTGNIIPSTEYVRESSLQLNGTRPEGIGRTLLPGLIGSHRVSSVFLEPVSLGNFATLLAAWGFSKPNNEARQAIVFIALAVLLMILADSRFALITLPAMLLIRFVLHGAGLKLMALLPVGAVASLAILASTSTMHGGDDYLGRLFISGESLLGFSLTNLMGIPDGNFYGDQGYAYIANSFGLPLCILLWGSFWLLQTPDAASDRFRALITLYIAFILCVSGNSLFAFKSSALVWFLMGCTLKNPIEELVRRRSRDDETKNSESKDATDKEPASKKERPKSQHTSTPTLTSLETYAHRGYIHDD